MGNHGWQVPSVFDFTALTGGRRSLIVELKPHSPDAWGSCILAGIPVALMATEATETMQEDCS
jgi:hypothetical protein